MNAITIKNYYKRNAQISRRSICLHNYSVIKVSVLLTSSISIFGPPVGRIGFCTYSAETGRALVRSRSHGLDSVEVGRREDSTGERWLKRNTEPDGWEKFEWKEWKTKTDEWERFEWKEKYKVGWMRKFGMKMTSWYSNIILHNTIKNRETRACQ